MSMVWPVISDAAGEARNTTAPATSIGSPMRCSAAMRSTTSARKAGSVSASWVPGVWMNVGATVFTVMLYFPHSTARRERRDRRRENDTEQCICVLCAFLCVLCVSALNSIYKARKHPMNGLLTDLYELTMAAGDSRSD